MKQKLIVVVGNGIGCGKTTIAEKLGVTFNFSDSLHEELVDYLNLSKEQAAHALANKDVVGAVDGFPSHSWRDKLKMWGMYRRDNFGANYWVTQLTNKLSKAFISNNVVCVTGLGFSNEVAGIEKFTEDFNLKLEVIYISRSGCSYAEDTRTDVGSLFTSPIRYFVNDRTVDELVSEIKSEIGV